MKLKPEQLSRHLEKQLLPIYLVTDDEPSLIQETCDLIRSFARKNGFMERELHHGEPGEAEVLLAAACIPEANPYWVAFIASLVLFEPAFPIISS